ncbi:zeta-sarcoglycan [Aplysia californica]|uniref:Zeta-sarcoglycan n=1 Tax=Aplysia californica TaxID=6500 RepID=A0ABM0JWP8_APLCA|nr:zeta-sarcoglycan [Aplysia californica]
MESEDTNGILDYPPPSPQPVGIYGWRKRCIYAFVLILMVVVIMNLALTVWILRVLDFSVDGMGRLRIVPKGFELRGEAEFLRPVYVEEVKSLKGSPLYLQSEKAVEILAVSENQTSSSSVVVDSDSIQATCDVFKVENSKGDVSLMLKDGKISMSSTDVAYSGNIKFDGSVSTPSVMSPMETNLQIRADSSKVQVSGMGGVVMDGDLGHVMVTATEDICVTSTTGAIHLRSQDVVIKGLPGANSTTSSSSAPSRPYSPPSYSSFTPAVAQVFQLCLCGNGRLFLGLPSGDCRASASICSP